MDTRTGWGSAVGLLAAGLVLAGCLESNPQPSPGGGGGTDSEFAAMDAQATAEDSVAADATVDGTAASDAGTDQGPGDAGAPDLDVPVPEIGMDFIRACCEPGAACPEGSGWICVEPAQGEPVCLVEPSAGRCWVDAHCPAGQACTGAAFCPCTEGCDTPPALGHCVPTAVAQCVSEHTCDCVEGGCMDGWGITAYYPASEGPFPGEWESTELPEGLLDVAVATYECSVCTCTSAWEIQVEGEWVPVDVQAFCEHLVAEDAACGGCLVPWETGCC